MFEIAVAGSLGGLVKSLFEQKGRVMLPKYEESGDEKFVHLGFVANVVLGAITSYYLATDPSSAFTTGIAAAFTIEKFLERTTTN